MAEPARQVRILEPGQIAAALAAGLAPVAAELSRPAASQPTTRRVRYGRSTPTDFKWPTPLAAVKAKPKDAAEFVATAEAEAEAAKAWHAEQVSARPPLLPSLHQCARHLGESASLPPPPLFFLGKLRPLPRA